MEFSRDRAANTFDLGIRRSADESPLSPRQKLVGHKYTLNTLSRQTFAGYDDKKAGALGPGLLIIQLPPPGPPKKALGQSKSFEQCYRLWLVSTTTIGSSTPRLSKWRKP